MVAESIPKVPTEVENQKFCVKQVGAFSKKALRKTGDSELS